jgi:flagellin
MEDRMSFRVNTNVAAMNALRNVSQSAGEFNKSITRLSTGLRINTAADDPAGLIISENFRAQLSGIDQAVRNSQDAINYAKTAEGALDEVNRLLRDARGLAVAAGNTGTLSSSAIQANQSQLSSIVSSITRIAQTTQFGTKKLLDGSSGVSASVTAGTLAGAINLGGQFAGAAVTSNTSVVATLTQAATQASVTGVAATLGQAVGAGSFSLNGVAFTTSSTTTGQQVIDQINAAQGQTGVAASFNGTAIVLNSTSYGSTSRIDLADANGIVRAGGAGSTSATGANALATVQVGTATALFTSSQNGNDGLTLSDADGNTIKLTSAGNVTASVQNQTLGQVIVGNSSFQIGANAGQSTNLSLGNFAASQLGGGVVSGLNLSNLDITTATGASNALKVIDAAVDQVSKSRGQIGSFQRNVLESNIRSLGTARENLAATESTIRDTDVAAEMTNFTKLQILQQAGMSVLSQANSAPQAVLNLLRG